MSNILDRKGVFYISEDLLIKFPYSVRHTLGHMIVTRCEYIYARRAFEYHACCDLFDVVDKASEAPEYVVDVKATGDIKVKRV